MDNVHVAMINDDVKQIKTRFYCKNSLLCRMSTIIRLFDLILNAKRQILQI